MHEHPRRARWRAVSLAAAAGLTFALTWGAMGAAVAEAGCENANTRVSKLGHRELRNALRCLVNTERRPNLRPRDQLNEAAQRHTGHMRRKRCVSHQCPGEPSLHERIRRTGYFNGAGSYTYGEAVASSRSSATPRQVVRRWQASSGHWATLMSRSFEHIGVGSYVGQRTAFFAIVVASRDG